jgi:phenylacetic acid degradation operon negative regulatory protein
VSVARRVGRVDPRADPVGQLVAGYAAEPRSSARTLLATLFGDSIEAHGGTVWLGSLIELVAPLGISERLVRTSVHRLVLEGILVASQVGRRSFYSLTASAQLDFAHAERRIYHHPDRSWDGQWTLVVVPDAINGDPGPGVSPKGQRGLLGQRLGWLGFGRLGGGTFAHPTAPVTGVVELVSDLGLDGQVILLRGLPPGVAGAPGNGDLARRCFDLDAIAARYQEVTGRYGPVLDGVSGEGLPEPATAFLVRTLLVDDYRRVLLRDPELPPELLPRDWAGDVARDTVARLYRAVTAAADTHLERVGQTVSGPLPPLLPAHRDRFTED